MKARLTSKYGKKKKEKKEAPKKIERPADKKKNKKKGGKGAAGTQPQPDTLVDDKIDKDANKEDENENKICQVKEKPIGLEGYGTNAEKKEPVTHELTEEEKLAFEKLERKEKWEKAMNEDPQVLKEILQIIKTRFSSNLTQMASLNFKKIFILKSWPYFDEDPESNFKLFLEKVKQIILSILVNNEELKNPYEIVAEKVQNRALFL